MQKIQAGDGPPAFCHCCYISHKSPSSWKECCTWLRRI